MTTKKTTKVAKPMTMIVGTALLTKGVTNYVKRTQGIERDGHILACSLINHIIQHGDHTLATTLVNGISKAVRRNALIGWFEAFSQVKYDTKQKIFVKVDGKANDLTGAVAKPFTEFKSVEGTDYTAFKWDDRLAKLITDAEKALAAGVQIDPQSIKALKAMVNPDVLAKAQTKGKKPANAPVAKAA